MEAVDDVAELHLDVVAGLAAAKAVSKAASFYYLVKILWIMEEDFEPYEI